MSRYLLGYHISAEKGYLLCRLWLPKGEFLDSFKGELLENYGDPRSVAKLWIDNRAIRGLLSDGNCASDAETAVLAELPILASDQMHAQAIVDEMDATAAILYIGSDWFVLRSDGGMKRLADDRLFNQVG